MANVFSQANQLRKMQKEAKSMEKRMKSVVVTGESKDNTVKVEINGTNEIENIDIAAEMLDPNKKQLLEKNIMLAMKDASKKLQRELVKDMDLEKMRAMLGV